MYKEKMEREMTSANMGAEESMQEPESPPMTTPGDECVVEHIHRSHSRVSLPSQWREVPRDSAPSELSSVSIAGQMTGEPATQIIEMEVAVSHVDLPDAVVEEGRRSSAVQQQEYQQSLSLTQPTPGLHHVRRGVDG